MIIVYYRRPDRRIRSAHEITNMTFDEVRERVIEYNNTVTEDAAYAIEVGDDSLEAYLMKQVKIRERCTAETIQDAVDSLYEALDSVRSLQVEH